MNSRLYLRVFFTALLTVATSPVYSDALIDKAAEQLLHDPSNADHLVLVAFTDKTITRISNTATSYRKRGDYATSTWGKHVTEQIAEDYHLQKVTEWPMTEVGVHCVVYQVPKNASVSDTLQQLTQDSRIDIAQNMHTFSTKAHQGTDPYVQLQANLQAMQISQAHTKTTGKNITIAMIDTGVDLQHPDLIGQISQNQNFAENFSASFDNDKHGTAVAGIMVAKKDNSTGIIGIAPDANLIALKACWPEKADSMAAACNSLTLAMAVNTAIKSDAKIINMSLTGPHDAILELLLNKAIAQGIIVVAADTGEKHPETNFPASLKDVISVQSFHQEQHSATDHQDLVSAPGEKILTTLPHATYDFISGSSISAAEVSGIIALLLEIKPDLTLIEAKNLLLMSAKSPENSIFQGINANNAVLSLCATINCTSNTAVSWLFTDTEKRLP